MCGHSMNRKLIGQKDAWAQHEQEPDWTAGRMGSSIAAEAANGCPSSVKFCSQVGFSSAGLELKVE